MKDKKLYINYRYLYKKLKEDIQKGRSLNDAEFGFNVAVILGRIGGRLDEVS
jgi:hypothetical protein